MALKPNPRDYDISTKKVIQLLAEKVSMLTDIVTGDEIWEGGSSDVTKDTLVLDAENSEIA